MRHISFSLFSYFLMLGLGASAYRGGAEILSNCRFNWPSTRASEASKASIVLRRSRLPNQIPLRIFVHRAIRQLADP